MNPDTKFYKFKRLNTFAHLTFITSFISCKFCQIKEKVDVFLIIINCGAQSVYIYHTSIKLISIFLKQILAPCSTTTYSKWALTLTIHPKYVPAEDQWATLQSYDTNIDDGNFSRAWKTATSENSNSFIETEKTEQQLFD